MQALQDKQLEDGRLCIFSPESKLLYTIRMNLNQYCGLLHIFKALCAWYVNEPEENDLKCTVSLIMFLLYTLLSNTIKTTGFNDISSLINQNAYVKLWKRWVRPIILTLPLLSWNSCVAFSLMWNSELNLEVPAWVKDIQRLSREMKHILFQLVTFFFSAFIGGGVGWRWSQGHAWRSQTG